MAKGRKKVLNEERIRSLKEDSKLTWREIAAVIGCSDEGARRAYKRLVGQRQDANS